MIPPLEGMWETTNTQILKYINTQILKYTNTQIHKYTKTHTNTNTPKTNLS